MSTAKLAKQAMNHEIEDVEVKSSTHEYGFQCSFDGNGAVYNRDSKMLWRFKTLYRDSRSTFPLKFFGLLPDFVLYDSDEHELLTIRCERRYPLSRFVMIENALPICTIRLVSILQNKYAIEFNNGCRLSFLMPLFTVNYKGMSENGDEVLVRLVRHDTWYVKIPSAIDNPRLVAALAFLHRERQR